MQESQAGLNQFRHAEQAPHAHTVIERSDFGLSLGILIVGDEITLEITACLRK
jgi:hypothetical protein